MNQETKNPGNGQSVTTATAPAAGLVVPTAGPAAGPSAVSGKTTQAHGEAIGLNRPQPVRPTIPAQPGAARPGTRRAAEHAGPAPATPDEMFRGDKTAGLVMASRLALRRGERGEARAKLKEAFAIDPTDCGALELLGDIFLEEAEQEKAIAVFERGIQYHPQHRAFEEKIALAHLDLAEMERDRLQRELLLTHGDTESWRDRKPTRAFGLSLLLPGAGHYYADEIGRGAWFIGAWILAGIAWYLPLNAGFKYIKEVNDSGGTIRVTMSNALHQLHPFWSIWFYLFAVVFAGTYVAAAYDAWRLVDRANAARRRFLGL